MSGGSLYLCVCGRTWSVREDGWIAGSWQALQTDHTTKSYCTCGRELCRTQPTWAGPR